MEKRKIYKGYEIKLHGKTFMAREVSGNKVLQARSLKELTVEIDKVTKANDNN